MKKPGVEVVELLRNIQTEIGAGMVLFPKSEAEHAHNNACNRANKIIQNYREGFGLFQMTRKTAALGAFFLLFAASLRADLIPPPTLLVECDGYAANRNCVTGTIVYFLSGIPQTQMLKWQPPTPDEPLIVVTPPVVLVTPPVTPEPEGGPDVPLSEVPEPGYVGLLAVVLLVGWWLRRGRL